MFSGKDQLKILFFCTCVLLPMGPSAFAADEKGKGPSPEQVEGLAIPIYENDIAAFVNSEIITTGQIMREMTPMLPRLRAESRSQAEFSKKIHQLRRLILDSFIDRILIVADFKAKGGQIPDSYEKKEYESFLHDNFNDDRIVFTNYLRESGQSMRSFKKDIREHAIVGFIMNNVQEAKQEVSPAKIKKYYNTHIQDFVVDQQFLVFEISSTENIGKEDFFNKLSEISAELSLGANVQELVRKQGHSLQISEIGWVTTEDLIPEYAEALRTRAESNITTQPIEKNGKLFALAILGEKQAKRYSLEEVQQDIERELSLQYQREAREAYIEKLRQKSYIKIMVS